MSEQIHTPVLEALIQQLRVMETMYRNHEPTAAEYTDRMWFDRCKTLLQEVERLRNTRWQPIESAPRDGTEILLWQKESVNRVSTGVFQGRWISHAPDLETGWYWAGYSDKPTGPVYPTHWMPLPDPPKEDGDG